MTTKTDEANYATSTGQPRTAGDWLDMHYQMAEPEYLIQLDRAGLQPGWRVLDAGCGNGCFLPAIAERLGPTGQLSALDLAPEHVAAIQARLAAEPLACPVDARAGSLLELPYPDRTFDAVWCANVSLYLTDDELRTMLAEFVRVLKPGGVLALKETDSVSFLLLPIEPTLLWRIKDALAKRGVTPRIGELRALRLGSYLREAGFQNVARTMIQIERSSPLRPIDERFLAAWLAPIPALALQLDLSAADCAAWRDYCDPDSPGYCLRQPDIFFREGNVLFTGCTPERSTAHGL